MGHGRFEVTRIRLRHFRSIASADISLGPFTVLVGPNGSGKSNVVDSLRFLSQALDENLDNALRERGGVAEVRRRSTGHPTHFGIRLDFRADGLAGSYGFEVAAVKGRDYRVSRERIHVESTEFGTAPVTIEVDAGTISSSMSTPLPRWSDDRLFLVALSGLPEFRPVFDGLTAVNVYNLNPDAMRRPQQPDPGDLLRRDGSNVASVLESLRRGRPELKVRIEEYLRAVVPGVESVSRKDMGGWETLEFRQRVAGAQTSWTFPGSSMSDGTLRALGVLVALFANDTPRSPIAIEEPEAALHPAAAGILLDALRAASAERQVLATSHSPDLLDSSSIRPEELLAVRVEEGTTHVGRLDQAGSEALRSHLYTAGELLRVDQLQPAPTPMPQQPSLFA